MRSLFLTKSSSCFPFESNVAITQKSSVFITEGDPTEKWNSEDKQGLETVFASNNKRMDELICFFFYILDKVTMSQRAYSRRET